MPTRLSDSEVRAALATLTGWTLQNGALARTVKLPTFPLALAAVVAVGASAQAMNHHPDIDIRYRTLTFTLLSHDAGGLTERDIALAKEITAILDARLAPESPAERA